MKTAKAAQAAISARLLMVVAVVWVMVCSPRQEFMNHNNTPNRARV
jgi:hypothetical protein